MEQQEEKSPARVAIDACGGIQATAALIGRDRSVVNRWLLPKQRGGTGGLVPAKHWDRLMVAHPELSRLFLPSAFEGVDQSNQGGISNT